MEVDNKTATSLSKKLMKFQGTLPDNEAHALGVIMSAFYRESLEVKRMQEKFKAVDLAVKTVQGELGDRVEALAMTTPTITLTTLTTTIASHPIITCSASAVAYDKQDLF